MKKFLAVACAMLLSVLVPLGRASAAGAPIDLNNYQVENLSDVLTAEGITYDIKNYTDTDTNKTIIYLFRLAGCQNCKNFLQFVADELLPNYSDKFVVKSFLLAGNGTPVSPSTNDNLALAERLVDFYGVPSSNTTPFVFAGENVASLGPVDATTKNNLIQLIQSGNTYNAIAAINSGATGVNPGTPSTPTDMKTEIFMNGDFTIYADPAIDSTYDFRVTKLDRKDIMLKNYNYVDAYDFAFYHNNQVVPMENGKYTLYIPVSEEYKFYRVAYLKDGKVAETFDTTYANGFVSFTTSHLSEYAVYGTNNAVTEENPNTLDQAGIYLMVLGLSALFIAGGVIAYRKFAKH